jgi:hypothetical protein
MIPVRRLQRIASTFNSKARKYHVPGVVSWQMLAAMPGQCAYCPIVLDNLDEGTWDHVLPFDRGGHNTIDNIVRCCTDCQRRKFTKTPDEFAASESLRVVCPIDGTVFKPRWAEWQRGVARYCSLSCAGIAGARKREANRCVSRQLSSSVS